MAYAPRNFGFETLDVGYHWLLPSTSYDDLRRYFTHHGVDFLVHRRDRDAEAFGDPRFAVEFEHVKNRGGYGVFRYVGAR